MRKGAFTIASVLAVQGSAQIWEAPDPWAIVDFSVGTALGWYVAMIEHSYGETCFPSLLGTAFSGIEASQKFDEFDRDNSWSDFWYYFMAVLDGVAYLDPITTCREQLAAYIDGDEEFGMTGENSGDGSNFLNSFSLHSSMELSNLAATKRLPKLNHYKRALKSSKLGEPMVK